MSTYAIGDVQGCFDELNKLLETIHFDPAGDQLWFCGDLVNRGPHSLEVMRFVRELGDNAIMVLGNHDLHLLAAATDSKHVRMKDTLDQVLEAPDRDVLLDWLRMRPFLHHDSSKGFTLLHAGLPPQWDLSKSVALAEEIETVLRRDNYGEFFDHMYGDRPDKWSDNLKGWDRLRFITNCLTRLRYCDDKGRLLLEYKGPPGTQGKGAIPWFMIDGRRTGQEKIIFGHWSTVILGDIEDFSPYNVFPLDTGCLWGGSLTALRLEDEAWFSVPSQQPKLIKK